MPAILRIFLYQTLASLTDIGSYASNGIIVGQGAGRRGATSATRCRSHLLGWSLQNLQSVREGAYGIVYCQACHYDHCGYHYHFECCLHLCVFTSRGR